MSEGIVVYRNPLEKMLWEGVMNAGTSALFVPIFSGIVIFFLALVILSKSRIMNKFLKVLQRNKFLNIKFFSVYSLAEYLNMLIAGLLGIFVCFYLWI